jgi:hypothetical protein
MQVVTFDDGYSTLGVDSIRYCKRGDVCAGKSLKWRGVIVVES